MTSTSVLRQLLPVLDVRVPHFQDWSFLPPVMDVPQLSLP